MTFFNMFNGYTDEARKCLQDTEPGTRVNHSKFTRPGGELEHFEYMHVLKVAEVTNQVWTAAVVFAQHYNWQQKRGEWVCPKELASTAKLCQDCFDACVDSAMNSGWITLQTDSITGENYFIPAIGESNGE
jgi:hypothetical protein